MVKKKMQYFPFFSRTDKNFGKFLKKCLLLYFVTRDFYSLYAFQKEKVKRHCARKRKVFESIELHRRRKGQFRYNLVLLLEPFKCVKRKKQTIALSVVKKEKKKKDN